MNNSKTIFVYGDWTDDAPQLIGRIYADGGRGKELFSFEYDRNWLENLSNGSHLDPDLAMFEGRQYAPADKTLFGLFSDSCPDRTFYAAMDNTSHS